MEQFFATAFGAQEVHVKPRECIFRAGERPFWIGQVITGRVSLVRTLKDGKQVVIAMAQPGDTFAEAALFADVYHCDAISQSASKVRLAPCDRILSHLRAHPEATIAFAAHMARHLRHTRARLEIREIKHASDRVLAWCALNADGDGASFSPAGSWAQVAGEIGLTPEALYRALRELEDKGLIRRKNSAVTLN